MSSDQIVKKVSKFVSYCHTYNLLLNIVLGRIIWWIVSLSFGFEYKQIFEIGLVYILLMNSIFLFLWKKVFTQSPSMLIKLYLGMPALRLVGAALVVILILVLLDGRDDRIAFMVLFTALYLINVCLEFVFVKRVENIIKSFHS